MFRRPVFTIVCMALIMVLQTGCEVETPTPEETTQSVHHQSQQPTTNILEAGEWNDLNHWNHWRNLVEGKYYEQARKWRFHTGHRLAFNLQSKGLPAPNVKLELKKGDTSEWVCRTDNQGRAEMWIDLFKSNTRVDLSRYRLFIDDQLADISLTFYEDGINEISMGFRKSNLTRVEVAFVIDATGSMKEEYAYLRTHLPSILNRALQQDHNMELRTATVLFRDESDEFTVKSTDFQPGFEHTNQTLQSVQAEGGADYQEAVDLALNQAVNRLNWSMDARTRIAFLFLDGPPRFWAEKIVDMQRSVRTAATKGIKLIPITTASIDEDAEFLSRFFAISTNGTYTFLTVDDSSNKSDPTLGNFETQDLKVLLGDLIGRYSVL